VVYICLGVQLIPGVVFWGYNSGGSIPVVYIYKSITEILMLSTPIKL
jgi:hypothetical protein